MKTEDDQLAVFYLLSLKEAANAPIDDAVHDDEDEDDNPDAGARVDSDDDGEWGEPDHMAAHTEEERSPSPHSHVIRGAKLLAESATSTLKRWLFA